MENKDNKKYKLSIYLIKESYKENSEIIPNIKNMRSYPIMDDKGGLGTLYIKTGYTSIPKWADFFSDIFDPKAIRLENKSARAVLVTNIENRKLCLTFGHAHFLVEPLSIVRNFGLRVALNVGGESSLRAVDKTSLDVVGIQTKEQSSKEVGITNFGFDIETDILKSITAKNEDGSSTLSGRDSVSVGVAVSLGSLRNYLVDLLLKYNSDDYKKKFAWVDNISVERDKSVIENLNKKLIENIAAMENNVWLAIPEIVLWEEVTGFAYKIRKNPAVTPDIHLQSWSNEVVKGGLINVDYLKRKKIYLYDINYDLYKTWSVYQCLNAEIDYQGKKYVLNDTGWYLIDDDFVSDVNNYYDSIAVSDVELPPYGMMKEPEYNAFVVDSNPNAFDLLDRKLINIYGRSTIEFCDLFTNDKKIIHVKKYGSSSVLSHLFQQGVVSGELFISDVKFRKDVNEKLSDDYKLNVVNRPDPTEYEVCYAIMSDVPGALHMPFFSKVVMKNAVKRLQAYGYKVTKKKIEMN